MEVIKGLPLFVLNDFAFWPVLRPSLWLSTILEGRCATGECSCQCSENSVASTYRVAIITEASNR